MKYSLILVMCGLVATMSYKVLGMEPEKPKIDIVRTEIPVETVVLVFHNLANKKVQLTISRALPPAKAWELSQPSVTTYGELPIASIYPKAFEFKTKQKLPVGYTNPPITKGTETIFSGTYELEPGEIAEISNFIWEKPREMVAINGNDVSEKIEKKIQKWNFKGEEFHVFIKPNLAVEIERAKIPPALAEPKAEELAQLGIGEFETIKTGRKILR